MQFLKSNLKTCSRVPLATTEDLVLITKMNMQRKEADAGYLPSKENSIRTMKINEVIS